MSLHTHTHTHTRLTALFPWLPRWASTIKVKPIWILLKQETVSGSGISWAICKSAPRSRHITTPATHHSVFYRPDALLPPNRQRQITEGISFCKLVSKLLESFCSRAMPKQRSPLLCGLLWRTICFRFTCYWSLSVSVLWRCWLGITKSVRLAKNEWWGVGVVICLERSADFFAYGPADCTATQNPIISSLV